MLKSLDIPVSHFDSELTDLRDTFSDLIDSLKRTHIRNSNLDDTLIRISSKNEERHIRIEAME